MKKITKLMLALCLCCAITGVSAADYYVSATGNDNNDGLSAATPVSTMNKINALLSDNLMVGGHTVWVDGMIDINDEPLAADGSSIGMNTTKNGGKAGFFFKDGQWEGVTIKGLNEPDDIDGVLYPVDGFTGKDESRLFAIDGGNHFWENIKFTGGSDWCNDGGGAFWLRSSTNTFTNCLFIENKVPRDETNAMINGKTQGRGGAIILLTGTLNLINCTFENNLNKQGGAIYVSGGALNATGCVFKNHDNATLLNQGNGLPDSHGGVLYFQNDHANTVDANFDRCVFTSNTVANDGGVFRIWAGPSTKENPYININFTNSAMLFNDSGRGGAFLVHNERTGTPIKINLENTVIFGNSAKTDGGAIVLWAAQLGDSFTMTNCTMATNRTAGNGGHGGNIRCMESTDHPQSRRAKAFYNCILDGNQAGEAGVEYTDFAYSGAVMPTPTELIMANCFIGRFLGPEGFDPTTFFVDQNMINYCTATEYDNLLDFPGFNDQRFYGEDYYTLPMGEASLGRGYGNADFLTSDLLLKDQFGVERAIVDGACTIGAVEGTYDEFDENGRGDYPYLPGEDEPGDGIEGSNVGANNPLVIIDGVLQFAESGLPQAQISIYSLSGTIVKSGVDQVSVADLPEGLYIAKAQSGSTIFVQKFVK